MSATDQYGSISAILTNEIDTASQLLRLLMKEKSALDANDQENLKQVLPVKHETIKHLEQLGRQRASLMQQAGFSSDRQGMEKYIDLCASRRHDGVLRDWRKLSQLAEKCRLQNEVNGLIIQGGIRLLQRTLAILRGEPPGNESQYGPDGETLANYISKPLASA